MIIEGDNTLARLKELENWMVWYINEHTWSEDGDYYNYILEYFRLNYNLDATCDDETDNFWDRTLEEVNKARDKYSIIGHRRYVQAQRLEAAKKINKR